MIDLRKSLVPSPELHLVEAVPGDPWERDLQPSIEAPPDADQAPAPEARWDGQAARTGICGTVSPRVLVLPNGNYRMYYSQMLPRAGNPAGANDYDHCTTRILSAYSTDGFKWTPEPGVRLSAEAGGAGDYRVVSSEVVPTGDGRLRMYYECCCGPQSVQNTILSAVSDDGLKWTREPGARIESEGRNVSSPRIIFFPGNLCRMYFLERGEGIRSAVSHDGLHFTTEPGVRIAQDSTHDAMVAFAPEIFEVAGKGYTMFYAGYASAERSSILRADSVDGLSWNKSAKPILSPGGKWDAAKSSEMCLYPLPKTTSSRARYRMVYEACDGTAMNKRGVWRIAGATST